MALTLDSAPSTRQLASSASSLTYSHAYGGGAGAIYVAALSTGDAGATISGVTWNGEALTQLITTATGGGALLQLWRLRNPVGSGAHNVVITSSASVTFLLASTLSLLGNISAGGATNVGTASNSITVADGSWVVIAGASDAVDVAASTNVTSTVSANPVVGRYGPKSGSGSITLSYTGSGALTVAVEVIDGSGDTTAPVLTAPVGSATGPTTATVGATTDEGNGTLYAVVTTSATQPSVAQIKAGQTHTGSAAPWGGSVTVSSTGAKTLSATGLTAATAYYAHLVHADAAANDSNRVSSASFTTSSIPGLTSNPLKNNTGTLLTSQPFEAYVSNPSTGALVVKKTGLTSHATTGVVTFTDAALAAATSYRVVWRQTTTGAEGLETLTAA